MDHGNPSLEGTTNVTITVLDVNDQVPQFPQSSYNVSVAENTAKGTSVGDTEMVFRWSVFHRKIHDQVMVFDVK